MNLKIEIQSRKENLMRDKAVKLFELMLQIGKIADTINNDTELMEILEHMEKSIGEKKTLLELTRKGHELFSDIQDLLS
jgi:hypothetical protein